MNYKTQKNRLRLSGNDRKLIEAISISCTRLYNVGLYSVRQHFQNTSEYLNYARNYHECKSNEHYGLLQTDVGQQVLRIVERNCKSFFALLKLKQSGKYGDKVCFPNFRNTNSFSSIVVQGRSARIRDGYVYLGISRTFAERYGLRPRHRLKFRLPKHMKITSLKELRIVPRFGGKEWDIHFVYEDSTNIQKPTGKHILGIDLGINNFASCVDDAGYSFLLDGRYLKSVNQGYNKQKSKLKYNSRKFVRVSRKRENRITEVFNQYVNFIIRHCQIAGINKIIIGELNKQKTNLGKINNQNFYYIPYGKFVAKLKNKCQVNGIEVHLQEESYTSKCSFLDNEELTKHDRYIGKRIKRGLFRTGNGLLVNADINGAANILRKHRLSSKSAKRVCSGFVNNPRKIFRKPPVLTGVIDYQIFSEKSEKE